MEDPKNPAPAAPVAKSPVTVEKVTDTAPEALSPVEAGVGAWVDAHLRNSVVARQTEVWNYLVEALKALPAFIEGK